MNDLESANGYQSLSHEGSLKLLNNGMDPRVGRISLFILKMDDKHRLLNAKEYIEQKGFIYIFIWFLPKHSTLVR